MNSETRRYSIIYADPPWDYGGRAVWDRGAASDNYATQSVEWIASLPVERICAWDAAIFLWATTVKLREALYTMRAWGFEYKNVGFTWVKTNKQSDTPFFGVGQWTRGNAELCLFGTRGSMERKDKGVSQVIMSPVLEHSRKPDETRIRIVRLLGDLPRIELFARPASPMFPKPPGWDWWGDEVESDVDIGSLVCGPDRKVPSVDPVSSRQFTPLSGQLDLFDEVPR